MEGEKMPSQMDVAPWCYKWVGWMDGSPGGVKYRAPYGANKWNYDSCPRQWVYKYF